MKTPSLFAALVLAWGPGCAGPGLDADPFSESNIELFELRVVPPLGDDGHEPEGRTGDPAPPPGGADGDCSEPATDKDILSAIEAARASAAEDFEADFWAHLTGRCLPASAPESDDSVPSLR